MYTQIYPVFTYEKSKQRPSKFPFLPNKWFTELFCPDWFIKTKCFDMKNIPMNQPIYKSDQTIYEPPAQ